MIVVGRFLCCLTRIRDVSPCSRKNRQLPYTFATSISSLQTCFDSFEQLYWLTDHYVTGSWKWPRIWRSNTTKIQTSPFVHAYHHLLATFKYSIETYKPSLTTFMPGVATFKHSSKHSFNQVKHSNQAYKIYFPY